MSLPMTITFRNERELFAPMSWAEASREGVRRAQAWEHSGRSCWPGSRVHDVHRPVPVVVKCRRRRCADSHGGRWMHNLATFRGTPTAEYALPAIHTADAGRRQRRHPVSPVSPRAPSRATDGVSVFGRRRARWRRSLGFGPRLIPSEPGTVALLSGSLAPQDRSAPRPAVLVGHRGSPTRSDPRETPITRRRRPTTGSSAISCGPQPVRSRRSGRVRRCRSRGRRTRPCGRPGRSEHRCRWRCRSLCPPRPWWWCRSGSG